MTYPYPAGQYPTPGPPARPKHLRGYRPLWVALIALIIAIVLFVVGGVVLGTKSLGRVNGFHRVDIATGQGSVTLDGTGKWVGYYEASDVSDSIDRIPHVQVAVTDPSGQNVTFKSYGNRSDGKVKKLTYDYKGHKGAAAFQFTAREKGTYRIQLRAIDTLPSGADIAIGRDIAGGTIAGAGLILGGVLFIIVAIVLLIVGLVKRGRHKSELAAVAAGGYGGAVAAGQWPQPQYPAQPPAPPYGTPPAPPYDPAPGQQQWPNQPPTQQPEPWPAQPQQPPPQQWPPAPGTGSN